LNDALRQRLLLDRQREYLDMLDEHFGPVSPEEEAAAQEWWRQLTAAL
jgi:hypothetical protein